MVFVSLDKDMELEIGFDRNKHSAEKCNENKNDDAGLIAREESK